MTHRPLAAHPPPRDFETPKQRPLQPLCLQAASEDVVERGHLGAHKRQAWEAGREDVAVQVQAVLLDA